MSISIKGYDIVTNKIIEDGIVLFNGVAHVEEEANAIDVEFEGMHEQEQLGFRVFYLKDPDEIDNPAVKERANEIRDALMDQFLKKGWEIGEYYDHIQV